MPTYYPQLIEKSNHRNTSAVSFKEFSALARSRSWTVQALAERFRGRIDSPADFFARVLSRKYSDNVIPYRSVIEFYFAAQTTAKQKGSGVRWHYPSNSVEKVRQISVNDFLRHV